MLSPRLSAQRVQAQTPWTFVVNTTEDLPDPYHNSVCSAGHPTDGPCSLRAAIFEAAHDPVGDVVIKVPPGVYKLTLTQPSRPGEEEEHYGDLDFPEIAAPHGVSIRITGTGGPENPSVIDANFIDRVMEIGKNQAVFMENLVLKNGLATGEAPYDLAGKGGGIFADHASVILDHVRLTNNEARSEGNAISNAGGIYGYYSQLHLSYCELDHNRSDIRSALFGDNSIGPVTIYSTSIHHNVINLDYSGHVVVDSDLVITNSTMSDNVGGAYYIYTLQPTLIQNSTMITKGNVGVVWNRYNLRLWFNIFQNIPVPGVESGPNCRKDDGYEPSLGGNIFSDATCSPGIDDRIFSYDIMRLGPLANYGGPTPTIPLMHGSRAIDFGIGGDCTVVDGQPLMTDQRFMDRNDGKCDTGAFELQSNEDPAVLFLPLIHK